MIVGLFECCVSLSVVLWKWRPETAAPPLQLCPLSEHFPRAVSAAVLLSARTLARPTFSLYVFKGVELSQVFGRQRWEITLKKNKWTRIKFSFCLRSTCVGVNRRSRASKPRSATFPFVSGSSWCEPAGQSSAWRLWASQSLKKRPEHRLPSRRQPEVREAKEL